MINNDVFIEIIKQTTKQKDIENLCMISKEHALLCKYYKNMIKNHLEKIKKQRELHKEKVFLLLRTVPIDILELEYILKTHDIISDIPRILEFYMRIAQSRLDTQMFEKFKLLVEHGALLNFTTLYTGPLLFSFLPQDSERYNLINKKEYPITIKLLIESLYFALKRGLDLFSIDEDGDTILHKLMWRYNTKFANFLFKNGIVKLVNTINSDGETAFMIAAHTREYKAMNLLLKNGADIHMKDLKDKNALDYAKKSLEEARGKTSINSATKLLNYLEPLFSKKKSKSRISRSKSKSRSKSRSKSKSK